MLRVLFLVHLLTAAGFNFVLPFLPLYVRELRGPIVGTAVWSGVIFAAPAFTMMLFSPLWGVFADRYGRKPMLVRATLAGAVVLALMGLCRTVTQLALLRALQGMVTGYQAASNALVAATVPRRLAGGSLGFLRTGTWIGVGIGPLIGGVVGEYWGIRQSFWVTSAALALSGLLVLIVVQENFIASGTRRSGMAQTYRALLKVPALAHLYAISFLDSLARSAMLPVFPLYVRHLMRKRGTQGVASTTGLLLGMRAFAGTVSSRYLGRVGDRIGHGRVVALSTLILLVLYLPQPFLTAPWQLVVLHVLIGFAAVGLVPGVAALFALNAPEGSEGATFALESSIDALGRTIGPMVGAAVAHAFRLHSVFGLVALLYLALAIAAWPLRHVTADGIPASQNLK